jgi:four helix bundle protein
MQDFRKLRVWQRSQQQCVELYLFSADFPPEERYGTTAQLRRSALSVGSNIAEASKRKGDKDKARILNIAQGEAAEVMSILDIVERLGYGRKDSARAYGTKYDELIGMIESLCQRVLAIMAMRTMTINRQPRTVNREPSTVNRQP